MTSQTITVPILNDATFENSETFTVTLSARPMRPSPRLRLGTILDDGTGLGGADNDPTSSFDVMVVEENPFAVFMVS